jgi:N-acetylglucosamine kinase-like BadF-type ATPase
MHVMGIDGGGSGVRVVITDEALNVLASAEGGSANPNSAGREAAAQTVQQTMRAALSQYALQHPTGIAAVGVGIAGTITLKDWVRETVAVVLPDANIIPVSDFEVALVGANGVRRGVLILAGTGSVAFGINAAGETAQVGGWGYLLGDEGSGYLIGLKALQAVVRAADGRESPTALTAPILDALNLTSAQDLIQWIYTPGRTREVAKLAPLVLGANHDAAALDIITEAVSELALIAHTVVRRLKLDDAAYAFAGGLLSEENAVSTGLCAALGLPAIPQAKYPPVIGAALLALG